MKFSVAAGAGEVATLSDIMYMQDMTTAICKNSAEHETRRLMDTRDFKTYWIAKLKDGNCWMTQNLDFDIPATLYSTTSDVNNTSVTTNTAKVTTPNGWNSTDNTYNAYYDPGDYYYNGPNGDHAQDTANSCTDITDGLSNSKCSLFTTTGDAHYHVGNYYSWSAATVKSGDSLTNRGDQAPDSICPKSWGLPASGTNTSNVLLTDGKTFAKLFEAYNWIWNQGYYTDTLNGGTSYNIYTSPFYFTYGGNLYSSTLVVAGYRSFYWSSIVYSDANAFGLNFLSNVFPANSYYRYGGLSVRCVAE